MLVLDFSLVGWLQTHGVRAPKCICFFVNYISKDCERDGDELTEMKDAMSVRIGNT